MDTTHANNDTAGLFDLDSLLFEDTLHDADMTLPDAEATEEQQNDDTL